MTGQSGKFKVAHVVRRFAFEEWGGTETVVWNSARHLVEHGVESAIFATRACSAVGDEVRDGIPIRRFDYFYPYWPLGAAAADALICVGANEEKLLHAKYPERRVLYLPNGIDPERMARPVGWDFREKFGIPEGRILLCCIARIDYQKNQLALIRAAALLRARGADVGVVLIGPVSAEWYAGEMRREIAEAELDDRICWLPGVEADDELLPAALRAADFFVLPSLHEPFGIAVLEAWSAGVPVIAARVGGLQYLIREGENGRFCDPGRPESIAEAVELCRRDMAETGRMAERARHEAEERYSWAGITARLADFYREVKDGFR